VARWWGVLNADFPDEDPTATRFVIEVDGAVVGMVQYFEEADPIIAMRWSMCSSTPALHGRGLGTEALRGVVEILLQERGHHRITIDPPLNNAAAIRTYEKGWVQARRNPPPL